MRPEGISRGVGGGGGEVPNFRTTGRRIRWRVPELTPKTPGPHIKPQSIPKILITLNTQLQNACVVKYTDLCKYERHNIPPKLVTQTRMLAAASSVHLSSSGFSSEASLLRELLMWGIACAEVFRDAVKFTTDMTTRYKHEACYPTLI